MGSLVHFADKWRSGHKSVGGWLSLVGADISELLAAEGFEWLVVDMQHSAWTIDQAVAAFRAMEARGAIPFARVPNHDFAAIGRILDAGAVGIVVPNVSAQDQCERIVKAARFPPEGRRAQGEGRSSLTANYNHEANRRTIVVIQIEDVEGLDNVEAICCVEGVDAVFIGTGDLALSMGLPRDTAGDHAVFRDALAHILAVGRKAGRAVGIPAPNSDSASRRFAEGYQFVTLASDIRLLRQAIRSELSKVVIKRGDATAGRF